MAHLRLAKEEDLYEVLDLTFKLWGSSVYKKSVEWKGRDTLEALRMVLEQGLAKGCILILEIDNRAVGCLVASWMNHMFNKEEKTAIEMAFYILPGYQTYSNLKTMIGAYRYWAKSVGCTSILLGKLKNDKEIETYQVKRLK